MLISSMSKDHVFDMAIAVSMTKPELVEVAMDSGF